MPSINSKVPSKPFDPAKERKKYDKLLREIEQLKSPGRTLDTKQKAKVDKEAEYRKWIEDLDGRYGRPATAKLEQVDNYTDLQQHITDATQSRNVALESQAASKQLKKASEEEVVANQSKRGQPIVTRLAGVDSCADLQQHIADVTQSRVVALESEVASLTLDKKSLEEDNRQLIALTQSNKAFGEDKQMIGLKQRCKALEEENQKILRRERQKATELDKSRKHAESLEGERALANAAIEALKTDFAKEREDIAVRHARELDALERRNDQMKKKVEKNTDQLGNKQGQVAKGEARIEELTKLVEEKGRKISELQRIIDSKGLEGKIERQEETVKKMSAKIGRKKLELEKRRHEEAELSIKLQDMDQRWQNLQEGCEKLETENREKHEERKRLAACLADLHLKNGRKLEALLEMMEAELSCPIKYELPEDPVVAADGWTYERKAIARWQIENGSEFYPANSPMTGARLDHEMLATNFVAKKMIALYQEWKSKSTAENA